MLPPHLGTQLVRTAASRTAGHHRRTWSPQASVGQTLQSRASLQGLAIVLALIVVAATSLAAGTVVRVRTVPIEVTNLAPGLRVLDQSAVAAQLQLRGRSWALDTIEGAPLTAPVDVRNLAEGVHDIGLGVPRPLPLGVMVEAISPERITFRLRPVKDSGMNP
jgi:hypothetical protein